MTTPLQGIRVLDFGRYVAGPYCATLLGYLGAEVIRVEKLSGGEDRYIAPFPDVDAGGLFMQTGCNKRSLALDFSQPLAREAIKRLLQTADVVVANLSEAALQKLGLDWTRLHAVNPRLILATQTAFGERGPLAGAGGFDGVAQAMSGAAWMTGQSDTPAKAAAPYVDFSTALFAAFGVMVALRERDQTGEGQQVRSTLLGTALAAFGSHLAEQSTLAIDRQPSGNRVQTSGHSDVFRCQDGSILTHVVGNGLFRRCARLLGREDWLEDPELQTDQSRGDARDRLCDAMAQWCKQRSQEQALVELTEAGVPCGPVLSLQQALDHPQVAAMGWLHPVQYPGACAASAVAGLPLEFSASQTVNPKPPPRLGEHSAEILQELGFDAHQIARLT